MNRKHRRGRLPSNSPGFALGVADSTRAEFERFVQDRCIVLPSRHADLAAVCEAWGAWCSERRKPELADRIDVPSDLRRLLGAQVQTRGVVRDGAQRLVLFGVGLRSQSHRLRGYHPGEIV